MTEWTGRQESAGMAGQHGPWTINDRREQYRNQHITVNEDRVRRPDGQPGPYAAVTMQPGVAVLCATGAEQITRVAS